MEQIKANVLTKQLLAPGVYQFVLHCPTVAATAAVGQFVNIKADGFFLRRPISICCFDAVAGTVTIVLEVRGPGTAALANVAQGQSLDIIAPLGKGFVMDGLKTAILVGGGIGTPPLLGPAQLLGKGAAVHLGFRTQTALLLQADFAACGCTVEISTEDGSVGHKGYVTQTVRAALEKSRPDAILACGPTPMLKALKALAQEYDIPCQLSLEAHMACGMGACLVCACAVAAINGQPDYKHVCKDGPVFNATQVLL